MHGRQTPFPDLLPAASFSLLGSFCWWEVGRKGRQAARHATQGCSGPTPPFSPLSRRDSAPSRSFQRGFHLASTAQQAEPTRPCLKSHSSSATEAHLGSPCAGAAQGTGYYPIAGAWGLGWPLRTLKRGGFTTAGPRHHSLLPCGAPCGADQGTSTYLPPQTQDVGCDPHTRVIFASPGPQSTGWRSWHTLGHAWGWGTYAPSDKWQDAWGLEEAYSTLWGHQRTTCQVGEALGPPLWL